MTQTEALLKIAERNGNMLTPSAVIDEARNTDSVLHGAFTWDDTIAAEKWRIKEAQDLIRECRIKIVSKGRTVETYAFIGLSTDRHREAKDNPYRLAEDVARNEALVDIALNDALNQLKALKNRYSNISKLQKVWDALDEVLAG